MPKRSLIVLAHDTLAALIAWALAYWLRFNFQVPDFYVGAMLRTLAWVVPLHGLVFWQFGLYRGMWRFASIPDLKRIVSAVGVASVLAAVLVLMLGQTHLVPRSVLVLHPILLVVLMGGSRLAYRSWKEHRASRAARASVKRAIVLGAGAAAVTLVRELKRNGAWRVVGMLDDDAGKHGRLLEGIRVYGSLDQLGPIARELDVHIAIIAMPAAHHAVRRRALMICDKTGLEAMTVPTLDDLVSGKVTVSAIRKVELDDLLGRDPVVLDNAGLQHLIGQKVVMVTGAGGSIGSELCRQLTKFNPRQIVFFELNEFALYNIEQEFKSRYPKTSFITVIGDAKNEARVHQVMDRYRPSIVLHAAAYKHVPLMEVGNSWEAVCNNVLSTHTLARGALRFGVEKFVLISTDKAVQPVNVMGASKRLAEMICQALQSNASTRFIIVRFGNVLGSAGSVVPKFREQIAAGGPITVTDPEVTRYFMSLPEAAQLVLQAGLMGRGGEVFVLDMGDPVRIVDLARDLIRLSGFSEDEIGIEFTGLRPGERLYEQLLADEEQTMPTPHPKLRIAQARPVEPELVERLIALMGELETPDDDAVRRMLSQFISDYKSAVDRTSAAT